MRLPFLASMAIALFTTSAVAADLGGAPAGSLKDDPYIAPAFNWSGFYIGGHGGYAWSDADWTFKNDSYYNDDPGETFSQSPEGWFGGGQIGFNQQLGRWVMGLDGTLSGGDIGKTSISPFYPESDKLSTDISMLWTVTGRVGYAWDRWLAYGKVGYAGGKVETTARDLSDSPVTSASNTETHHGWAIGGGLEYLLARNIVLGVDYTYVDLGKSSHDTLDSDGDPVALNADVTTHAVTGRLSFKFGG